jgi:hypothetical protein
MEILERALKTIPGLALVFAIVAIFLLDDRSELAVVIRIFVVAWILYRISSSLDWFFDGLYGPGSGEEGLRRFLPGYKNLETNRKEAARSLHLPGVEGVYKKAKAFAQKAGTWETEVEPLIAYSKAARAFIVPCLLVLISVAISGTGEDRRNLFSFDFLQNSPLSGFVTDLGYARKVEWMKMHPAAPIILFIVCSVLYVFLRIKHMNKLYESVSDSAAE